MFCTSTNSTTPGMYVDRIVAPSHHTFKLTLDEIYLGHIQTETPYFQPVPVAPKPFTVGTFPGDPSFDSCSNDSCRESWALRIVDSSDIVVHSAGMYSFFINFDQSTCVDQYNCQESILQVVGSSDVVLFNLFTIGGQEIASSAR